MVFLFSQFKKKKKRRKERRNGLKCKNLASIARWDTTPFVRFVGLENDTLIKMLRKKKTIKITMMILERYGIDCLLHLHALFFVL